MRIGTFGSSCAACLAGGLIAHVLYMARPKATVPTAAHVATFEELQRYDIDVSRMLCHPAHPEWDLEHDPYVVPGRLPIDVASMALAKKLATALVRVDVTTISETGEESFTQGSGVVTAANTVLTAWHVAGGGMKAVRVVPLLWEDEPDTKGHRFRDAQKSFATTGVTRLGELDAAILSFAGEPFKDALIMSTEMKIPGQGELIYHLGFISDINYGHVLGEYQYHQQNGQYTFSQALVASWMPTYRGDSGGPVVTPDGRLLGISVMISGTGMSYNVPMRDIKMEIVNVRRTP